MKTYKYVVASMAILLGITAAGCSSDKWEPGPQDDNVGVSAYFETPKTTAYIFGSDFDAEDMTIDVKVMRENTEKEASVPVIITSKDEGFSCPGAVNFAAGEPEATFAVNCSGIAAGKTSEFTISLPEDETYTYGPGAHELTFSAIKADWVLLSDNARYLYSDTNYDPIYPATSGELYVLEGTKRFKLTDFFGSGLDMTFECTSSNNDVFTPLINADYDSVWDEDRAYNGWYLYDDATSSWPSWVPGDLEGYPAISYLLFYSHSDYNVCSMIYNPKTLYGYIGVMVGITFDNGNFKWGNFQVDFNMAFNPFE